jgi:hypothetical protein
MKRETMFVIPGTIIALYGGFVLFMYLIQERLVYFPTRQWDDTPTDVGLQYEEIWLTTSDGIKISGWFVPAKNSQRTILFLHGNGGNISHRLSFLEMFRQLGLNCFIIDYRGYGQSEGTPSEVGSYLDAEAAWNYLVNQRQIPSSEIIVWGNSLGGGVASWLALQHPPKALILASTFTSAVDIAAAQYPFLPVRLLAKVRYETLSRLDKIQVPILIIHSRGDKVIPYQHALRLFEVANQPKQFMEITGGHNNAWIVKPAYQQKIADFISFCFC